MIQTTIERTADNWQRIIISGHAGSGEYGFDVVCASVSVLSFNFVNSVNEIAGIEPILQLESEGGFLKIERPQELTEQQTQVWDVLFSSLVIGIQNISENTSQYVVRPVIKQT